MFKKLKLKFVIVRYNYIRKIFAGWVLSQLC